MPEHRSRSHTWWGTKINKHESTNARATGNRHNGTRFYGDGPLTTHFLSGQCNCKRDSRFCHMRCISCNAPPVQYNAAEYGGMRQTSVYNFTEHDTLQRMARQNEI